MVTLYARYMGGEVFRKVTVVKIGKRTRATTWGWRVVGPGFPWTGKICATWDEAIKAALNGR